MSDDPFILLRIAAHECREIEEHLALVRAERNRHALRLIGEGYAWRDVARIAGFPNSYLAELKANAKKKRRGPLS